MGFYREFPAWQLRQEQVVSPKQTALGIFRRCQSDSAPGQIIARSFGTWDDLKKTHPEMDTTDTDSELSKYK